MSGIQVVTIVVSVTAIVIGVANFCWLHNYEARQRRRRGPTLTDSEGNEWAVATKSDGSLEHDGGVG